MPETIANRGQGAVELELRLSGRRTTPLTGEAAIHVQSTMVESFSEPALYTHLVRSQTVDYVDNLLREASATGTPALRVRFGLGVPGNYAWLPWQEHTIEKYDSSVQGLGEQSGHLTAITSRDALFRIGRESRVQAHRGLISRIVRDIATRNDLESVVEDTITGGLYIQSFVDDIEFVRTRLQPRAVNAKSRGNYLLYIRDNALHFHSPDFQTEIKEIHYHQSTGKELTQCDHSQQVIDKGAAGTNLVVYNPLSGAAREILPEPAGALRLGNETQDFTKVPGARLFVPYHVGLNEDAGSLAAYPYETARMSALELEYLSYSDLSLRLGDIVNMVVQPGDRQSPWSGQYLVSRSAYDVDKGALVGRFILLRGEWLTNRADFKPLKDQGVAVVESSLAAQGQTLNQRLVQSSKLTRGQAGQTSRGVTLKSADPNTALR
jgi:hypothetical protein